MRILPSFVNMIYRSIDSKITNLAGPHYKLNCSQDEAADSMAFLERVLKQQFLLHGACTLAELFVSCHAMHI